ncbi:MAG TPA: DNA recombination protein RmuC [Acidimicrobiales bacterium]|nr:DNA recombination protein RmuC [Acidimicrobiales bacterium]
MLSDPPVIMIHMSIVLAAAVGLLLGGAVTWSLAAGRLGQAKARAARLAAELEAARREAARQEQAEERLANAFAAMSREALDRNTQTFLDLAGTRLAQQQAVARGELDQRRQAVDDLVAPLRDALQRVESSIAGVERARQEAYSGLSAQVRGLAETHERLRTETSHLAGALRSSQTRGRWGEVQLRRVVELAGMVPHCDFVEQATVERAGTVRRPDVIVRLPGDRQIAVDAKVPLAAYLQAHETDNDDERRMLLRDHARQLRAHVNGLADKAYWEQFPNSPDLVVLFLPGEPFLAAAYEHDSDLFEYAHSRRVLLATPTTLIALLQSVAFGWRQESMAANARAVCEVGQELYKRLATMGEHVAAVGKSLDKAVEAYNRQVGSLETRVLVTARRLADLDVGDGELSAAEPVERSARALQSAELTRFSSVTDDEVA